MEDLFLFFSVSVRSLGGINQWDKNLNNDVVKLVEEYWCTKNNKNHFFDENSDKEKFYILSMFPYPSGSLHMGHIRVYTISDTIARYYRMTGKNVIHPMGWDAFGLPAENAAFERNINSNIWTQKNIANMKSLLEQMNFSFDWNREFATCDSDYYKWTQFFFLKLYENGLVYRDEAVVNWDPLDKTVLANEQVDENGRSWRSGALVEKKFLKQWFIRTTKFSESLYEGLSSPVLEDWGETKAIQKNWLGKPNGTTILFEVVGDITEETPKHIPLWLRFPEYIDRIKFVAVKPNSFWTFGSLKNGLLPYSLRNPFTNDILPVYVTESVNFPSLAETHVGIPELNAKDEEFAKSVHIECTAGLQNVATKEDLFHLREKICSEARERGIGGYKTSAHLNDWLISRQRYWGTPIPIIYCKSCGEQPVPEKDLPVRLPELTSNQKGKNVLKEKKEWLHTACPKCGGEAIRETDTMDTFVDSSWYFLRFLDPDNDEAAFDVEKIKKFMPVDVYIGGIEHATLHLYFARFMCHFLHSLGVVPHKEPFKKLLNVGIVKAKTYKSEKGNYVEPKFVEIVNNKAFHKETKEPLIMNWDKMSKSKYNGIDPKEIIEKYGVDVTRLIILSEAAPRSERNWNEETIAAGIISWNKRLWSKVSEFIKIRSKNLGKPHETIEYEKQDFFIYIARNYTIESVIDCFSEHYSFPKAMTTLQALTKYLNKCNENVIAFSINYEKALATQIILLAPMAPYLASELWSGFLKAPNRLCNDGEILWDEPVSCQPWPKLDKNYKPQDPINRETLCISEYKSKSQKKLESKLRRRALKCKNNENVSQEI